jgi:hypothetical protein
LQKPLSGGVDFHCSGVLRSSTLFVLFENKTNGTKTHNAASYSSNDSNNNTRTSTISEYSLENPGWRR